MRMIIKATTSIRSTSSSSSSRRRYCRSTINILNTIVTAAAATTTSSTSLLLAAHNYNNALAVNSFTIGPPETTVVNNHRCYSRYYSTSSRNCDRQAQITSMASSSSDSLSEQSIFVPDEKKKEDNDELKCKDYDGCGPLEALCMVTLKACVEVTPAIEALYHSINSEDGNTKTKADDSVFTIADGLVQYILTEVLSLNSVVGEIVGEEDCIVNLTKKPYTVDDFVIPIEFETIVEDTISKISKIQREWFSSLSFTEQKQQKNFYQSLTAFIDPIDGTREFSTQKGEQCTVCVGFADTRTGQPVAGVVYRPLSKPQSTWAVGAKVEKYTSSSLSSLLSPQQHQKVDDNDIDNDNGSLLTTNGRISPFLESIMKELKYERVPSGGAGNKMLMLLEGKGTAYIQDRGVSRWDTCAAQAVLEANGGILYKLDRFMSNDKNDIIEDDDDTLLSYTYRKTNENLDFFPGSALLTKYNAAAADNDDGNSKSEQHRLAVTVSEVKPYANLCGLIALGKSKNNPKSKAEILDGLKRAAKSSPPAFD
jgi:3'-phosphoadenosine 5'-phosphosulfate (PAPS) 3'-phosphatase